MGHGIISEKALRYQEFLAREAEVRHHTYEEENYQFDLLAAGDPRAVEEYDKARAATDRHPGKVSPDPLRNAKYLAAIGVAHSCRVALKAGVEEQRAYAASDLYIQKIDALDSQKEIRCVSRDAFIFYLKEIQALDKKRAYSRPVAQCLDYIYNHLHEPITLSGLSELCGLSASYLSTQFKREMGRSVSQYIMSKKMEAARNMLKYSDYTYAEISAILNFSSQSHFTNAFKRHTGQTPAAYRRANYRPGGEWEGEPGNGTA